jgi:hypothetical protein
VRDGIGIYDAKGDERYNERNQKSVQNKRIEE